MILCHTGDWHLHPSRSRIDPESGLNARLMDFSRCARFCVEDSIARGAQLIAHCGDVFNGCRPTPTEVRLVKQALEPAQKAGVPTVMIKGNHDDVRSPAEMHALDLLRDMEAVTVVDRPVMIEIWGRQDSQGKNRYRVLAMDEDAQDDETLALQLACLPWPNRQLLLRDEETRKLDPGDLNVLVREKMMEIARGLVAQRIEGVPCLLLGHFSVDLAKAGTQNTLMMLGGDFTLNVHELDALDVDGILLGHIHKPQILGGAGGPEDVSLRTPIIYCGSPEAVTFAEEGEEKRYVLWTVDGPGQWDVGPIKTPYRRFVTLDYLKDFTEDGELDGGAPVVEGAIVRIRIPPGGMAGDQCRKEVEAAGAFEVRVEKERAETVRRREVGVTAEMGLSDAIGAWLVQRPDLLPVREPIVAEALQVERACQEGGAS